MKHLKKLILILLAVFVLTTSMRRMKTTDGLLALGRMLWISIQPVTILAMILQLLYP